MTTPTLITFGVFKLITTGICLSIGFWAGKKFTNRIDTLIALHSPEVRALIENKT